MGQPTTRHSRSSERTVRFAVSTLSVMLAASAGCFALASWLGYQHSVGFEQTTVGTVSQIQRHGPLSELTVSYQAGDRRLSGTLVAAAEATPQLGARLVVAYNPESPGQLMRPADRSGLAWPLGLSGLAMVAGVLMLLALRDGRPLPRIRVGRMTLVPAGAR